MLADGADEGHAQQPAHAKVDDGGRQQAGRPALQHIQAHRLIVQADGLQAVDGDNLLAGADAFAHISLKVFQKDLGHPAGHLLRLAEQMDDGGADEVESVLRDEVGGGDEFAHIAADASGADKAFRGAAGKAVFGHIVVVQGALPRQLVAAQVAGQIAGLQRHIFQIGFAEAKSGLYQRVGCHGSFTSGVGVVPIIVIPLLPSFRRKPESVAAGAITVIPSSHNRHSLITVIPLLPSFQRKPESVAGGGITVVADYDARFRLAPE